ncbi:hypothetical protein [Candidatus Leptofilum sp.]|uniref:hypothetical protein n=1 Tax=Candidatus Leptofilum sp. TaxID=3241576 RepID=UPI003B5C2361
MTNNPKPLSKELLRRFVAGELNNAENEAILAQLAEDDASLELADALWEEQLSQTAVVELPDLEPERAQRVRRRLIHRIHRSDLAKNVVKMGTGGFSNVAMSLLRPLLDNPTRERRNRRRRRGND